MRKHEGYIRIPFPWRKRVFAINWDEMRLGRRAFFLGWYTEFGALFIRMGFTYTFKEEVNARITG